MAILNKVQEMGPNPWLMALAGVCFAVPIVAVVVSFVRRESREVIPGAIPAIVAVGFGLFALFAILAYAPFMQVPTGKATIEATFLKDKPSPYILEKYEVIEQRGRIWVLEEK